MECFLKVDFTNVNRIIISLVKDRRNIILDEVDNDFIVKQIDCETYDELKKQSLVYDIPIRWDAINYQNKDSFIIVNHPDTTSALLVDKGFSNLFEIAGVWFNNAVLNMGITHDVVKSNAIHIVNKSFDYIKTRLTYDSELIDSPNELPDVWSVCVKATDDSFILVNQFKEYIVVDNIKEDKYTY